MFGYYSGFNALFKVALVYERNGNYVLLRLTGQCYQNGFISCFKLLHNLELLVLVLEHISAHLNENFCDFLSQSDTRVLLLVANFKNYDDVFKWLLNGKSTSPSV
jgi:hypothetical protein